MSDSTERRRADDAWRAEVDRRLNAGDTRMRDLEAAIAANTEITQRVDKGVTEMLAIFGAIKGFAQVTGWLGVGIKWVAGVLVALGIVYLFWRTGDLPRKD